MLRSLLLIALVRLGHNETINEGVRRFHIFFEDRKTSLLPPDTRKVTGFTVFPLHTFAESSDVSYFAFFRLHTLL